MFYFNLLIYWFSCTFFVTSFRKSTFIKEHIHRKKGYIDRKLWWGGWGRGADALLSPCPGGPELSFTLIIFVDLKGMIVGGSIIIKWWSSHPEMFLGKGVLKICRKFTRERPCRSMISIKLQSNFMKITLRHGRSPVIYRRTPMPKYDFSKVANQLYWNHTTAWVFSCKFAAYFQNTFS